MPSLPPPLISHRSSSPIPKPRMASAVAHSYLYRVLEATYITGVLPWVSEVAQQRYVYYSPATLLFHTLVFTLHGATLVMAQYSLMHRPTLVAEALPDRTWEPVPAPSPGAMAAPEEEVKAYDLPVLV